jgi:small Trp-rich protein
MSDKSSSSSSGIGVFGLLGIVFVTLKLLGLTAVAQWSWWWVTLPFWGGIVLWIAIAAIVVGITVARSR